MAASFFLLHSTSLIQNIAFIPAPITDALAGFRFGNREDSYNAILSSPASPSTDPTADRAYFRSPSTLMHSCTELAFSFQNWSMKESQQAAAGNSLTIEAAGVEFNGIFVPIKFDGLRSYTLSDGQTNAETDIITASQFGVTAFSPYDVIWIRGKLSTPAKGDKFARTLRSLNEQKPEDSPNRLAQFELYDAAATTVSTVDNTGLFTLTGANSIGGGGIFAPITLCKPIGQKRSSYLFLGDSIPSRYLRNLANVVPDADFAGLNYSIPGISAQTFNGYSFWKDQIKYADTVFFDLGTNDVNASASQNEAQALSHMEDIFDIISATRADIEIVASQLRAGTTSTDSFATKANQSVKPLWDNNETAQGIKDQLAIWGSDGTFDEFFDTDFILDPTDTRFWLTNGTPERYTYDGTHLSDEGDTADYVNSGVYSYNLTLVPFLRNYEVSRYGTRAPNRVKTLILTPADGEMTINWDAPYDGGSSITDYNVQYKRSTDSNWLVLNSSASTTPHVTVTGLTNNTAYDFRIAAINNVGQGEFGNVATDSPITAIYDSAIQSVFDASNGSSLTESNAAISNFQDSRGSAINFAQTTATNRPFLNVAGDGIEAAANNWLTSDIALSDSFFIIIFDPLTPRTSASTRANPISFANNASLTFGGNGGTDLIEYKNGNFREGLVSNAQFTLDTGATAITAGKHVMSVMFEAAGTIEITYDGTALTVTESNTGFGINANSISSILCADTGTRDFLGTMHEVRTYNAKPNNVTAIIAELKTKWAIS